MKCGACLSVRNAAPPEDETVSSRGKRGSQASQFPQQGRKAFKAANFEAPSDERVRALASSGQLETLTVPQLKAALVRWKLKVGGNKAELIARIQQHALAS